MVANNSQLNLPAMRKIFWNAYLGRGQSLYLKSLTSIFKLKRKIIKILISGPNFKYCPHFLKNRPQIFKKLGRYLKLGPEIKILIIMFSSFKMEVIS